MTIFIALLLGAVQGLCEFLPVSSSGHLVLLHNLFGIEEGALFFTIMLHVGTLLAVFAVYWRELLDMLRHPLQKRVKLLILATIPAVLIALFFKDFIEGAFGGRFLGFGFLLTAFILTITNRVRTKKEKTMDRMGAMDAICVGLMQGVAILPGISRSGSTIGGALFRGINRKAAADFSFLLSIPAILGSLVLELMDMPEGALSGVNWLHVAAGMAAAAVFGYIAIRWMIRVVKNSRMMPFAVYVALLGIFVLADQFIFNEFFARPF